MSNNSNAGLPVSSLTQRVLKRVCNETADNYLYEPMLCPECHKDVGDGKGDPGANLIYGPKWSGPFCPHCNHDFSKDQEEGAKDEVERPATEEKREVQIGNEIVALIGAIKDVSSPESRQRAYGKIEDLANELVAMHEMPDAAEDEYEFDSVHGKDANK